MAFAVAVKNPIVSVIGGGRDIQSSDLGTYYSARVPTLGTGIVTGTSVNTFVETTPTLVLYNAGPLTVYPMTLRTHLTAINVNAGAVLDFWTVTMDIGNRYTSGGTQLTIQNESGGTPASGLGDGSGAFVVVGAITATAASPKRRILANIQSKTDVIEVIHDTMVISWGDVMAESRDSLPANAAAPFYGCFYLPPCVIPPNCSLVIVKWGPNQTTGSTNEYQMTWMEK
jgi:hypothetical protein